MLSHSDGWPYERANYCNTLVNTSAMKLLWGFAPLYTYTHVEFNEQSRSARRSDISISNSRNRIDNRIVMASGASRSAATAGRAAKVVFSGIQPTGVPHLGNYAGALRQWVNLQHSEPSSTKLIYSIVDLHAITVPQVASQLREWRREALASLLAIGIDPDRCVLFHQSSVSEAASQHINSIFYPGCIRLTRPDQP